MQILSFGASTSSTSINRKFADHAASLVPGAEVTSLDLRTYALPIYSEDTEKTSGIPAAATAFLQTIRDHDGLIISLAEHNGSYTAAFKNLLDWTSRIETNLFSDKPLMLLSTSPGGRGGSSVMAAAKERFPRLGATVIAAMSLPSFNDNFSDDGISDPKLSAELQGAIDTFAASVK